MELVPIVTDVRKRSATNLGSNPSLSTFTNQNKDMAKYNNVKIEGYDSKKEYRRAKELKLLEKKGIITGLQ